MDSNFVKIDVLEKDGNCKQLHSFEVNKTESGHGFLMITGVWVMVSLIAVGFILFM